MTRGKLVYLVIAAALIVAVIAGLGQWLGRAHSFYAFAGLHGPTGQDRIAPDRPARVADFERGSVHRLAILVTDPASDWLGLARAFKAEGVPFTITQNPSLALQHKVVLVYPIISGRALSGDALRSLAAHVHSGGTILGFDLEGGGLESTFAIKSAAASRAHALLHWATGAPAEEQTTRFSGAGEANMGSYAFAPAGADIIARYEDGAAAVLCHTAVGKACLMGLDLGALARRAIDGRAEAVARSYVNQYEPSLDVLVRWVRDLYVEGDPMPYLIDTTPDGHDVAIVLSHDIDYTRSVANSRAYAELERAGGVKATYFMQTKYVRDYNDDVFLTKDTVPLVRALRDQGMEIASHTVAHSRVFDHFPLGDGAEQYPDYRPFVQTRTTAQGGTLFGETRVSKFLLETVGSSRVDLQACKLEYSIVSPK